MIHAICDFCGKDCDLTATLVSLTAFQNFARYHSISHPYGVQEPTKSFVICSDCLRKHDLPNPYEDYKEITSQKLSYREVLPSRKEFKPYQEIRPTLPVSIGDTLYLVHISTDYLTSKVVYAVLEVTVSNLYETPSGEWKIYVCTDKSDPHWKEYEYPLRAYGEVLFSTKEEAIAKFKEKTGGPHEET